MAWDGGCNGNMGWEAYNNIERLVYLVFVWFSGMEECGVERIGMEKVILGWDGMGYNGKQCLYIDTEIRYKSIYSGSGN